MKKIIVDPSFWGVFPDAQINVMVIRNFNNHDMSEGRAERAELLARAAGEATKFIAADSFRDSPVVAQWRKAYQQFKKKKGARASIEALLKRVQQGHKFEPTLPMVDLYNSVSLRFGVPVGVEDLDKIAGDLHLGVAKGGEAFFPLGAEIDNPAREGEIIYYDDDGAVCRSLNWREAQRTMLSEDTINGVVVIESLNVEQATRATNAMNELKELVMKFFAISLDDDQVVLTQHAPESVIVS